MAGVAALAVTWAVAGAPEPAAEMSSDAARLERQAVGAELSRGLAGLYIKGADRPYALRATLQRATLLYAVGRYGALVESQLVRRAMGEVEARVGAPARDSTQFFGSGARVVFQLPLVPDAEAARRAVWLAADAAYKGALESLDMRGAAEASLNAPTQIPDWSPAPTPLEAAGGQADCEDSASRMAGARRWLSAERGRVEALTRTLSEGFNGAPWI